MYLCPYAHTHTRVSTSIWTTDPFRDHSDAESPSNASQEAYYTTAKLAAARADLSLPVFPSTEGKVILLLPPFVGFSQTNASSITDFIFARCTQTADSRVSSVSLSAIFSFRFKINTWEERYKLNSKPCFLYTAGQLAVNKIFVILSENSQCADT